MLGIARCSYICYEVDVVLYADIGKVRFLGEKSKHEGANQVG